MLDEQNRPIFVIEDNEGKEGRLFQYNYFSKSFSMDFQWPQDDLEKKPVEILGYVQYEQKEDKFVTTECPITADYDELVSAAQKVYPFLLNDQIKTQLTAQFTHMLMEASAKSEKLDPVEVMATLIFQHEQMEWEEWQTLEKTSDMGMLNRWQMDMKAYLKKATQGATNHGPEINNPFPEPLLPGNYPAFFPQRQEILKNEEHIFTVINAQRKLGFTLMVNPKWGWEIDTKGELYVPNNKINWKKIDDELDKLFLGIETLKEDLNTFFNKLNISFPEEVYKLLTIYIQKNNSIPEHIKHSITELFPVLEDGNWEECAARISDIYNAQITFNQELSLVNLKIKVITLELAPTLCYANINKTAVESDNEFRFRKQVEVKVEQLALTARKNTIERCKQMYTAECKNYNDRHRDAPLVEKYRFMNPEHTVRNSS